MDEQKNNTRVIFTAKASAALDAIVKNYNLEETSEEFLRKTNERKFSNEVIIDHLSKDFTLGKISGIDLTDSVQREMSVPPETAGKISKEIINNIIPYLEKVPEEKLKDSAFVEELEKKVFGATGTDAITTIKPAKEESTDFFPKARPLKPIDRPIEKNTPPFKKRENTEKPTTPGKIKKYMPQQKQPKGPDNYREVIG